MALFAVGLISCDNEGGQLRNESSAPDVSELSQGMGSNDELKGTLISDLNFEDWLSSRSDYYFPVNLFDQKDSSANSYFLKQEDSYIYLIESNIIYQERLNQIRLIRVDFQEETSSLSFDHKLNPSPELLRESLEVSSKLIPSESSESKGKVAEIELKFMTRPLSKHRYLVAKNDSLANDMVERKMRIILSATEGVLELVQSPDTVNYIWSP